METFPKKPKKFHPNSLQARAKKDKDLERKLREGRKRAYEDAEAFENWYRHGFVS